MIEISVTLFMKPEDEIDIDYASSEKFRHFGSYLKEKMYYIADLIDKLENKNWSRSSTLYDIRFIKDISKKDAEKELIELGIDIYKIGLYEEKYDDEKNLESNVQIHATT